MLEDEAERTQFYRNQIDFIHQQLDIPGRTQHPDRPFLYWLLGGSYYALDSFDAAATAYQEFISSSNTNTATQTLYQDYIPYALRALVCCIDRQPLTAPQEKKPPEEKEAVSFSYVLEVTIPSIDTQLPED